MAKQHSMKAEDYGNRPSRPDRGCNHAESDFESCAAMMGARHCMRCRRECVHHTGYPNAYEGAGREWFTDQTANLGSPGYDE